MKELRRQSVGPLASLKLEAPPAPLSDPTSTATAPVEDVAITTTTTITPANNAFLRRSGTPPTNSVRPAFRLKTAATPAPFVAAPASGLERETWAPATSPAVSQMKREGFAVHDVAETDEGGFYSERLSSGRVQGGDGEEMRKSDYADDGVDVDACGGGREGSRKQRCLDYSECAVFATAPRAPRFAAFVADGSPQVSGCGS